MLHSDDYCLQTSVCTPTNIDGTLAKCVPIFSQGINYTYYLIISYSIIVFYANTTLQLLVPSVLMLLCVAKDWQYVPVLHSIFYIRHI